MERRFDSLIIDQDLESRMLLKEATGAVAIFRNVKIAATVFEGLACLCTFPKCDIIFIAENISPLDVATTLQKAKADPVSQDAAFVRVFKKRPDERGDLARELMEGIDGILFHPFSVDQLVEIAQLATKVGHDRAENRARMAMTLAFKDVSTYLDLVSEILARGFDPSAATERLRAAATSMQSACKNYPDLYAAALSKAFSTAVPMQPEVKKGCYKGVSTRLRRRMAAKLIEKLDESASGDTKKR